MVGSAPGLVAFPSEGEGDIKFAPFHYEIFGRARKRLAKRSLIELLPTDVDREKHEHIDSRLVSYDPLQSNRELHPLMRDAKIVDMSPEDAEVYVLGDVRYDSKSGVESVVVVYYKAI